MFVNWIQAGCDQTVRFVAEVLENGQVIREVIQLQKRICRPWQELAAFIGLKVYDIACPVRMKIGDYSHQVYLFGLVRNPVSDEGLVLCAV
ncbi:unnamed protein product [Calypogeia fissa]